jgi:phosphoglycerol transferase MdoB-like AlkP superfamily enzyme
MRSEFAFLSGVVPEALDIHRFNPYRKIALAPVRALPSMLRQAGYATTCIHPHPARFFRRDRAFPNLGFERFIDMSQFRGATKCGPYIGDEAVTDRLLHEVQSADGPSFFFVITMENHGPLHLESIGADEWRDFYTERPPAGCEELTVYLRHLRNADRQLGRLREALQQRARPCMLVFYGEHIPSMPKAYDAFGLPDGRTDYFIEATQPSSARFLDLKVENLAEMIIADLCSI